MSDYVTDSVLDGMDISEEFRAALKDAHSVRLMSEQEQKVWHDISENCKLHREVLAMQKQNAVLQNEILLENQKTAETLKLNASIANEKLSDDTIDEREQDGYPCIRAFIIGMIFMMLCVLLAGKVCGL